MSRYNRTWDEKKFKKYIDEGRGQGQGADYKPWITIHDLSSNGISSRQPGWKTNRVCHFLSNNELNYYYILEWADCVVDIREQFPLLPVEDTIQIAEELSVKHPTDAKSKTPYVMTSDFMITVRTNGKDANIVRTIKMSNDLEDMRVLEKLEIERRYWLKHGVDWGIVTEKDIPKTTVENIAWVFFHYMLEPTEELGIGELLSIGEVLKDRLEHSSSTLGKVASHLDQEMNLETGTCLYLLRHLIARKEVILDMDQKIGAAYRTSDIKKIMRFDSRVNVV